MNLVDVDEKDVSLDELGVGAKSSIQLALSDAEINSVSTGDTKTTDDVYTNVRTEIAFKLAEAIKNGVRVVRNEAFIKQLLSARYKVMPNHKIRLMTKEEMRNRGIPSGDEFDAACLSYYVDTREPEESENDKIEAEIVHDEMLHEVILDEA